MAGLDPAIPVFETAAPEDGATRQVSNLGAVIPAAFLPFPLLMSSLSAVMLAQRRHPRRSAVIPAQAGIQI